MSTPHRTIVALVAWLALLGGTAASAQPLGTFRWQIQPYCNILSISVVQQGGLYLLNGTDDQCGAPVQASVTGLAFQNPTGAIGLGLTVVTTPGGAAVHFAASISVVTLNGVWRNSTGRSGTFIFTPGAPVAGPLHFPPPQGFPMTASAGGDQDEPLDAADEVVRTVTLTMPVPGRVLASASGNFNFNAGATADAARCSITTGNVLDAAALIVAAEEAPAAQNFVPFSGTRSLTVSAGTVTINLVCDEFSGDVRVTDTQLTVLYVPLEPLVVVDVSQQ